jgi:predicted ArsR family transcriptional regulator
MRWRNLGEKPDDDDMTPERPEILAVLLKAGHSMSIEEVAKAVGIPHVNAKQRLRIMHDEGQIARPKTGMYAALSSAQQSMDLGDKRPKPGAVI